MGVSGCCAVCVMEGSRPIMAEVQALVTKSGFSSPRRTATGLDYNRLYMIIAVLEKRLGFFFGGLDAYVNVIGGMKIDEPACDLPAAAALWSGLTDKPIGEDVILLGEIGLGGEVRGIPFAEQRILEAQRMGFTKIILPRSSLKGLKVDNLPINVIGVSTIRQAFDAI